MAVDLVELATQRRLSITAAARDETSLIAAQEMQAEKDAATAKRNALLSEAKTSKTTYAGFSISDLSKYFGTDPIQTHALITAANGGKLSDDLNTALASIDPKRLSASGDIAGGLRHLSEHTKGSHYSGDFNVGNTQSIAGLVLAPFTGGASLALLAAPGGTTVGGKPLGDKLLSAIGLGPQGSIANPKVTTVDENSIAAQAAQDERRRRALLNNQNRLIKTTPLGARISGNQLGGQNTITGGY